MFMKGNRGVRNTENLIHHQSRTSVLAVTFERKCDFFFVHNPYFTTAILEGQSKSTNPICKFLCFQRLEVIKIFGKYN